MIAAPWSSAVLAGRQRRSYAAVVLASGLFAALLGVYGLYTHHGVLVPDSSSYAHGRSAWSSPVQALAGGVGGIFAVRLVALVALVGLAVAVAWRSGSAGAAVGVVALLVVSPPGWALLFAGADALGALAVVLFCDRRGSAGAVGLALACLAHLAAGIEFAACVAARRFGLNRTVALFAAGAVAMAGEPAVGLLRGVAISSPQWRYLLPAVAVWARGLAAA